MVRRSLVTGLIVSGLFGFLFWTASCAVDPVSGQPGLMLLSEEKEIQLGRQTDAQIVQQYGLYKDSRLTAHVDDAGQRMAKLSHRPHLDYQFKVLDVSVVNAFAVPGGYVYFTRGILAHLNSEAELAGVMGHEIGHITARHSAEQYSRAMLAQVGLAAGMIFSETLRGLADFAQLGVGMLFLKFSRDNEREADDLGVEYASKAGYEASQMANFFETLEKMNPGSDRTGLPSWFSTHPSPVDRVQTVRAQSREWQRRLGIKDPKVGHERYLRWIDGLVFGEDPRQGYVEDHVFYHPDLKFQFPVPADWKVKNTPSQVQIVSPKKDAAILFSLTSRMSPKQAARKFAEKTRARVISADAIQVHGLSSYRMISDVRTRSGILRVMSYFIKKREHIYVFHGICSPSLFQRYEDFFGGTMGRFKHLSDPKRINVQPDRIRIREAKRAGSVKGALQSVGVPDKELEKMALLNGKSLDEKIPANTPLKVVQKGR
ncbi:MAG: M48 family metalloprotease [Desulfobacteraceae bacterium]|jgi:predicted Zn-dependent protease